MIQFRNWSIRWKVGLHLLIILLLIVAHIGGVWWFLQEQGQDGTAINEAGEQRMLTQKMTWEAHQIKMGDDEKRAELAASAAEFDHTLTALIEGNETMGLPPAPPAVRDQLLIVQAEWKPFHDHVQAVVEEPQTSQDFDESLTYIETNNHQLLTQSNQAVQLYEKAFEGKVERLQLFLLSLVVLDLLVIPLLFILVNRHILDPINRIMDETKLIANGDYDKPITIVSSDDEIGTLSRSVHEMKDKLISAIQNSKQFEHAIEHAGHAVYITEMDGTITYVNPAFEEMSKYSKEQAMGETPRILKSGHQSESYYEELWETILAGEVWEEEVVNMRASGELFHAYQTIAPITDRDGELNGFVAVLTDNTEQLVSNQQNQVLSRILRHNLRNELNLIDGYAYQIQKAETAEMKAENARIIRERAKTMERVAAKANRTMRAIQEEVFQDSQWVCAAVNRVSTKLGEQYPKAVITTDLPDCEIDVLVTIESVLEELVTNAIQHNDQDTPEVTIQVTIQEDEETPPPTVRVTIDDNGPGIPEDERLVIEKGRESPLLHGSGLGLWFVHWVVTLAGGEITISQRSPWGTCVSLTLPRGSVSPFPRKSPAEEHINQ